MLGEKNLWAMFVKTFVKRRWRQLSDTGQELPFTLHVSSYSGTNGTVAEEEWPINCEVFRKKRGINCMAKRPL